MEDVVVLLLRATEPICLLPTGDDEVKRPTGQRGTAPVCEWASVLLVSVLEKEHVRRLVL